MYSGCGRRQEAEEPWGKKRTNYLYRQTPLLISEKLCFYVISVTWSSKSWAIRSNTFQWSWGCRGQRCAGEKRYKDSPSVPAPQSGRRGGTGRRKWRRAASFHWSRSSRECGTAGQHRPDISYTRWDPTWATTQGVMHWLTTHYFTTWFHGTFPFISLDCKAV